MGSSLIDLIDKRLKELNLSERKACINAGLRVDAIRGIRRGNSPRIEKLRALAPVLGVPLEQMVALVEGADTREQSANVALPAPRQFTPVYVIGSVQGGYWRDAMEWPSDDWRALLLPADSRFPAAHRFALEVRGKSMDLIYPAGTILICVHYTEIGQSPRAGDKVICLRRAQYGDGYEATVKEYQIDVTGRIILWPRSTEPEFQMPLILSSNPPLTDSEHVAEILASHDTDLNGNVPSTVILAKVIQSIRTE
jgi:repressor LexA